MDLRFLHPAKRPEVITSNDIGKFIDCRLLQYANALLPSDSTVGGITMEVSRVQLLNA